MSIVQHWLTQQLMPQLPTQQLELCQLVQVFMVHLLMEVQTKPGHWIHQH